LKTTVITTLILICLNLKAQDKYFIDYNKYCDKTEFVDIYRLVPRVEAYCLEYNLMSIELKSVLNCGDADTGYFEYSNDTLFLYTKQLPRMIVENGDTIYINPIVECDCLFNISFDIYGFSKIPNDIYFNGKPVELKNIKYKKRETTDSNGFSEVLFDDCGYNYRIKYGTNHKIERIFREQGDKRQILIYNENQKLVEIKTLKYSIDNIRSTFIK
jgi:hypothetical protein